ncbi:hypothetical protein Y032_0053g2409 [Ancylostoma ceylanicum]|uniref:ShKT domain-containing protein n=1 Tax=Ancylostoma ceylanicum TaxID=53326 RepID=A0A016U742_9BILA|nr:hypothetical protein Y032_0053g2409 [Ancylostoma ceylanicum]
MCNFILHEIPPVVVTECTDTNPSTCQEMKEKGALLCNYRPHSDYCCQTCSADEETTISPPKKQTEASRSPVPSPRCLDNDPEVCERFVNENNLDCDSENVRFSCCQTCKSRSEYSKSAVCLA